MAHLFKRKIGKINAGRNLFLLGQYFSNCILFHPICTKHKINKIYIALDKKIPKFVVQYPGYRK